MNKRYADGSRRGRRLNGEPRTFGFWFCPRQVHHFDGRRDQINVELVPALVPNSPFGLSDIFDQELVSLCRTGYQLSHVRRFVYATN